ncbi:PREDICTED: serine/threonine-protein kinase TBK1-like [Priapulus caudatus]|uniref:Serine/threonine-protein kinase TBK1-like n=1 Tax=Priapulus caudatus TaxID=37621 RepID=A0ABM1EKA1_PRICU|nr:PREDICTED: serine/threonine-protein kinase TBK1-like [Priapulus caudatus]XP_014672622.1 PREDICTED: serine/threonine-protein kinase TBK1-like [Priapulus caudatus]
MAHQVQCSVNYIWSTGDILGQGSTGVVYRGYQKMTGDPVAVKTFNSGSHLRTQEVQMREFEIIRKVNHKNVVRLLSIEKERMVGDRVIVMELCGGGSLHSMLEVPENAFGLPEEEFLLVLEHIAAAMKHLRDHNLVHRDLKPGNIMRMIGNDGRSIYKLVDFGAARELEDEEHFVSLYGTEEYLHPDMYERALLRKCKDKTFGVSVDLWSIGVTLYHVATGALPFRPYGGRANQETMHTITSSKATGVISGVQHKEGGEIEWSQRLPDTCQLSGGLQALVLPLLAKLLEARPTLEWKFDAFFETVNLIVGKMSLDIFEMGACRFLKVYIEPDARLETLKEHIDAQTTIPSDQQLLIHDNRLLRDLVTSDSSVSSYPQCSESNPLVVYDLRIDLPPERLSDLHIPSISTFHEETVLDADYVSARQMSALACFARVATERCLRQQNLLREGSVMLMVILTVMLREAVENLKYFTEMCKCLEKRIDQFMSSHKRTLCVLETTYNVSNTNDRDSTTRSLTDIVYGKKQSAMTLITNMGQLNEKVESMKSQLLEGNALQQSWQTETMPAPVKNGVPELEIIIKEASPILLRFKGERRLKVLSPHDGFVHRYEKLRLIRFAHSIPEHINHSLAARKELHSKFSTWSREALQHMLQVDALRRELSTLEDMFTANDGSLDQAQIAVR